MKCLLFRLACCLVFLLIERYAFSDAVVFPVTETYDGAVQSNLVDKCAAFYEGNSSGVGADESLVLDVEQFRNDVRSAFSNGCGGVVSFDNAVIVGGEKTDTFIAQFGSKSLTIKSVDDLRTDYRSDICTPISGPNTETNGGFLAKSNVNGDVIKIRSSYNFTFTENDFSRNEHVHAVGGTILGRNGGAPASKWLMKATLDNGDIIAAMGDINFRTGKARDDTFFGARAPEGRYITGVAWICLDGSFSGLDGLAFITEGAVEEEPEPSADVSESSTEETADDASTTNKDYSGLFGY